MASCFLLGLFFCCMICSGAFASLITGLVLVLLLLILELSNKASCGVLPPGTLWHWIATINFLHYAVLLFVICTFVLFIVSMMTPPPPREKTEGLTYGGAPPPTAAGETKDERKFEVGLSVLLALLLGVLWIVFA